MQGAKFADDTKVFRHIKVMHSYRGHLQDYLKKLTEWSEKWQMLLIFGSVNVSTYVKYTAGGTVLNSSYCKRNGLRVNC